MKQRITIEFNSGDKETYTAQPPEFAKWEKTTGKTLDELRGVWDILFLAYNAMKREAGGKQVKPFDVWMETVADVETEEESPKAIESEA
jgi:hypothetical protein